MRRIQNLRELPAELRGGAVTVGNFDGVHRGHRQIFAALRQAAANIGGPSIVFTFEPHPAQLLRPDAAPPPLTWPERKAELIAALDIDCLVAYPTDLELLRLGPHEFFEQVLLRGVGARAMVEGPDFRFGRARAGDLGLLQQLCEEHEVRLSVVPPLTHGEATISSSVIRRCVESGDAARAAELLGRPHQIRGLVVQGARRGGPLGFPTANLEQLEALAPGPGVYAGRALADGRWHAAAIHIGPAPTFDAPPTIEAHLCDFSGDLYGQRLPVDFLRRLRDIRKFESIETLREQLTEDVAAARAAFAQS